MEIKCFVPLIIQSSPLFTALVFIPRKSEPASGSVIAIQSFLSPVVAGFKYSFISLPLHAIKIFWGRQAISANAKDVVANGGDTLLLILNELKNSDPTGRVSAEFDIGKIRKSPEMDAFIQAKDKIFIPHIPQEIYVLGEVVSPGTRLYSADFSVKD